MIEEYIKELKVAKYQCLTDTLFFTRYFFKKRFNRKFVIGEHHRIIAETLDRVINGELKKVIFNIAPRYGKTEMCVKNFIARGLSINPKSRYIHLSYSDDLALDNSDEVRDIVKSSEYQELFPNVKIKPKSDSKKKWYTSEDGGVYATSAAGQVTGFGAGQVDNEDEEIDSWLIGQDGQLFGGALIIDDPIKPEDADSDNVRERVNQRFDSTIRNRVNSRNTPIIIVMQRLHEKDLCGYLIDQEPGEWHVVSLPCLKEDGTALWEFKHTVDELEKIKANNKIVFERQYQQSPKPLEGLMFPENELRYYKPNDLLKFESSIAYADIADEGEDNLSAPVGKNIGKDIYITDVTFCRENTGVTLPMVSDMLKRNDVKFIRVESNAMGAMFNRELTKLVPNTKCFPAHSSSNKFTRILMDSEFIKRNCVFIHPSMQNAQYKAFMKELCAYLSNGKSKKDDAPDSLSGLAMFIRAMLPKYYL